MGHDVGHRITAHSEGNPLSAADGLYHPAGAIAQLTDSYLHVRHDSIQVVSARVAGAGIAMGVVERELTAARRPSCLAGGVRGGRWIVGVVVPVARSK